jgi:hypothetical protein
MHRAFGGTEATVTQAAVCTETIDISPQVRRDRTVEAAKVCVVSGLALCAISVLGWLFARVSDGDPAPLLLWSGYWWCLALAGLLGFWLAGAGLVLGITAHLIAKRRGQRSTWTEFILLVGVIPIAATPASVWLAHQPAYFLGATLPPSHGRLDAMDARTVARAYLTAQNVSVEYWLSDAKGRAVWHESGTADLSLLAGVSSLSISPLRGSGDPNDATHRRFHVRYVSRASDSAGNPPGPQDETMMLVRRPGGPWRVNYLGDGL